MSTLTATDPGTLRARVVGLFAITAGASAGSLYYLQPLLHEVGRDLGVSASAAGAVISVTQIGYLIGLALVVPLGDFADRRRLVTGLLALSGLALLGSAAAPGLGVLLALVAATGVTAASAQVVVPWAASLAAPRDRGAVVGRVMSGLLIGILGSRIVSGVIAEFGGWRTVLVVAAVTQALMALGVRLIAPADRREPGSAPGSGGAPSASYPQVLGSILTLVRRHPMLRHRMLLGALGMAGFSLLWTAIAFLLAGAHGSPYHLGDAQIGLFGLAGVAGALGAPLVGRYADRGHVRAATTVTWLAQLLGWGLLLWGGHGGVALIAGLLLFDFGVQGAHLSNQTVVYALDPAARSRITTAYMVAYFLGGVLGSALGGIAYQAGGWPLVCAAGAGIAAAGTLTWLVGDHRVLRATA